MERVDLLCPQCRIPLSHVTSYGVADGKAIADWPTHDVGRCSSCSRQFHIERATGEWIALPFEPLCPDCSKEARFRGVDKTLTAHLGDMTGLIYACPNHPQNAWTRNGVGDRWVQLSMGAE